MKYLARKRCTCLSQIAVLDKSYSGWSGAPRPYIRHFTPGVSSIPVKDGGQGIDTIGRPEGRTSATASLQLRRKLPALLSYEGSLRQAQPGRLVSTAQERLAPRQAKRRRPSLATAVHTAAKRGSLRARRRPHGPEGQPVLLATERKMSPGSMLIRCARAGG